MPSPLGDAVRGHLRHPFSDPDSPRTRALLAVLDECAQMRIPSGMTTEGRWRVADRIEQAIALALGIEVQP